MELDLCARLKEFRNQRDKLTADRKRFEEGLRSYVKENLGVLKDVILQGPHGFGGAEAIREGVMLVFCARLQAIARHFQKHTGAVFRTLVLPRARIEFVDGRKCTDDKNAGGAHLDDHLRMLYSFLILEGSDKKERQDPQNGLHVLVNIVSATCSFLTGKNELSTLGPVDVEWPVPEEYVKAFESSFRVSFDIRELKEFLVNTKLQLLLENFKLLAGMKMSDLETAISHRFYKLYGDCEILREGEVGGETLPKKTHALLKQVCEIIVSLNTSWRLKALLYSYVAMKYRGLARYMDTSCFSGVPEYYYVHWIDLAGKR